MSEKRAAFPDRAPFESKRCIDRQPKAEFASDAEDALHKAFACEQTLPRREHLTLLLLAARAASHPHHQAGYGGRLNRFSPDAAHDAQLSAPVAGLAKMVEQRFCKPKVAGSIPESAPLFQTTCLSTGLCTVPSPYFA